MNGYKSADKLLGKRVEGPSSKAHKRTKTMNVLRPQLPPPADHRSKLKPPHACMQLHNDNQEEEEEKKEKIMKIIYTNKYIHPLFPIY